LHSQYDSHDGRAASVPHVLGDVEVLRNTFGLPATAEGKHPSPEHVVDKVENALPKDENRGFGTIFARRSEKGTDMRNKVI
jgi:hypothetical protein